MKATITRGLPTRDRTCNLHKLLGVYLPMTTAKFAIGICNWDDSRPHKGLELLQALSHGARCSVRPDLDAVNPLYASRLHYAFAAVEDYNWCRKLAVIDTVSWDDEQDLRRDVCKVLKHAVKTFLLRVVRK